MNRTPTPYERFAIAFTMRAMIASVNPATHVATTLVAVTYLVWALDLGVWDHLMVAGYGLLVALWMGGIAAAVRRCGSKPPS
jgi:hypothetical protein